MVVLRPAHPGEAAALSALALRSKAHWGYSPEELAACEPVLTYTAEDIVGGRFHTLHIEADPNAEGFYLAMGALRVGEVPSEAIAGRMLPLLTVHL